MESKIDWNRLALTALAQYNLGAAQLIFLGHSENVMFRVDTRDGENFATFKVLRIHHPIAQLGDRIWQQQVVIESELMWLTALHQDTNLVVPYPLQNLSGAFITSVAIDDTSATLNCTLLNWVNGSPLDSEPTPTQARRVGELMAQLHQHTSLWELPSGFTRPKYDWEQLHTSLMGLRSLVDTGTISVQPNEHDYFLETVPYVTERLCSKYLQSEAFLFES
ncbi:MAG: hypothetical protein V7K92_16875 [Nostoc sp.]|uniref:phosphotransferase enzyme family protein n=1 Tax=Nostoc sp. TaxID=1180 RepID=UPI002FF23E36